MGHYSVHHKDALQRLRTESGKWTENRYKSMRSAQCLGSHTVQLSEDTAQKRRMIFD